MFRYYYPFVCRKYFFFIYNFKTLKNFQQIMINGNRFAGYHSFRNLTNY